MVLTCLWSISKALWAFCPIIRIIYPRFTFITLKVCNLLPILILERSGQIVLLLERYGIKDLVDLAGYNTTE